MATIEKTNVRIREDKVNGIPGKEDWFNYSYPSTIQEALKEYGEQVVYNIFKKQAIVLAQGVARPMLAEGKSHDEIQTFMDTWRPDVKIERTRVRTVASIPELMANFQNLDPEKRAEIIAMFQNMLNETTTISAETNTNYTDSNGEGSLDDEGEQVEEENEGEEVETEVASSVPENANVPEEYRRRRR